MGIDIFSQGEKKELDYDKGTIMSFKEIGDKIQGTLIDSREFQDNSPFGNGEMRHVYDILVRAGTEIITKGQKVVSQDDQKWVVFENYDMGNVMNDLNLGQIIGIVFSAKKPAGKTGIKYIVDVWAKDGLIDEVWLNANKNVISNNKETVLPVNDAQPTPAPMPATLSAATPTDTSLPDFLQPTPAEKLIKITALAEQKLGVKPPADVNKAIADKTGYHVMEENYDSIISALEKHPF